jgi:hypothetical protein
MLISAMTFQFKLVLRFLLIISLMCSLATLYIVQTTYDDSQVLVRPKSHVIDAIERHCLQYDVGGHMFNELGRAGPIHGNVVTCLIHSFSPYIEREAAKRFLDPARDNIYFANSPAVTWHNDQLVLVSRIWLDRERYQLK